MKSLQFKMSGMDCAEEIAVLKREVGPLVGGADRLTFDLPRAKMTVLDPLRPAPVKALFVALTFFGYATLWAAIAADMGASLLVIGNGLRLLAGGEQP